MSVPDGATECDGEKLVQDFFAYCADSPEIVAIDRIRHTLVAQSMNAPERPSVVVEIQPAAMARACATADGFSLSRVQDDPEYRIEFWSALFQEMLAQVEIVSARSNSLRLSAEGPFEEMEI